MSSAGARGGERVGPSSLSTQDINGVENLSEPLCELSPPVPQPRHTDRILQHSYSPATPVLRSLVV